ncbi:MAG: helix-turn-helix domain-containing protein [Candidatus Eremiobacteraeota bacterium]|nr:helix-turn-helix domain-containing protein [Candidatus Eremiobacteraeota bacterium]
MRERIAILAFPGFQLLDVAGPADVFSLAACGAKRPPRYRVEIVAPRAGYVVSSGRVSLKVDAPLARLDPAGLNTLLIAGGGNVGRLPEEAAIVGWLRANRRRFRRLGAVCTGALLLAAAGFLDGRRAVTHWGYCKLLAERHPSVNVDPDPIFIHDGVWTSAGVTAGIDLALAMVEEDHGPRLALDVARMLVMFVRRPGGQAQFSNQLTAQTSERTPIRDLQAWIADHPHEDLSVEKLAERAAMSPRHFARVFVRDVGVTPADYVESVRLEAAQRGLQAGGQNLEAIATRSGFKDSDRMRRAFLRRIGVTPREYRLRFRTDDARLG